MENNNILINTQAHLTTIITPKRIDWIIVDDLSREIQEKKLEISRMELTANRKVEEVIDFIYNKLRENCDRIVDVFDSCWCKDISIEPAIWYYVPKQNIQDPILWWAEPSAIVTMRNITRDKLNIFLHSAWLIWKKYSQLSEILKFEITKEKFDKYVNSMKWIHGKNIIWEVCCDNIIPTYEMTVNLDRLFKSFIETELSDITCKMYHDLLKY